MRQPRLGRVVALLAGSCLAVAAAASCSTFGEDDVAADGGAVVPVDGAAASDVDAGPASDASNKADARSSSLYPACPAARGAKGGSPTGWVRKTIYSASSEEYPFAIVTSTTHVTWIAQPGISPDAGDPYDPYNGGGDAIVVRAPKENGTRTTLAKGQPGAVALALDGDYAYWTTWQGGVATLKRTLVSNDCEEAGVCPEPEILTSFGAGDRISRLARPQPGLLIAQADSGTVYGITIGSQSTNITTTGDLPGLAVTDAYLFASNASSSSVKRASLSSVPSVEQAYLSIAPVDGGNAGVAPIATDCKSLWMVQARQSMPALLLEHDLSGGRGVVPRDTLPRDIVFDLAADESYVYAGAPNAGGGLFAWKRGGVGVVQAYPGNVHRIAVDDDGVYFGEHGFAPTAGSMYMLVKP